MDIKLFNSISNKEFIEVLESVGFKTYNNDKVSKAFKNTMYMVIVEVDGELAGIGRVVGDYSIVCCLSDICVKPKFQKKGIGSIIVNELKKMVENGVKDGEKMQIELTPTAGNEAFYQKAGFKYKPDVITGMYLWIKNDNVSSHNEN
ncbi:MAG: GNAT family N-acetyltransferase [Bacilli bacterium]|nr:GNAT family N-acetyltransferase [Bacilli bacterium]